jgi:hypothetical protein
LLVIPLFKALKPGAAQLTFQCVRRKKKLKWFSGGGYAFGQRVASA